MNPNPSPWQIEVTLTEGSELGSARFACTSPTEDFTVSGMVQRTERGIVITSLEYHAATPEGITASTNRGFRVGELLAYIRTARVLEEQRQACGLARVTPGADEPAVDQPKRPRRGGRALLTDDRLREVAMAYLEETQPGKPSGALARLADRFDRPEETVRTWLARARKDGWLGPSLKGRRGAEPGPRLLKEGA